MLRKFSLGLLLASCTLLTACMPPPDKLFPDWIHAAGTQAAAVTPQP